MKLTQKILLIIPLIIYVGAIGIISCNTIRYGNFSVVGLILAIIFFLLGFILFTILINTISYGRLSINKSLIISVWAPLALLGIYVVYNLINEKSIIHHQMQNNWRLVYEGREHEIDSAVQNYIDGTLLSGKQYKEYFTVIKPMNSDSSEYSVNFFFSDKVHKDTTSVMALSIISDTSGHVIRYNLYQTDTSPELRSIFKQKLECISGDIGLIKKIKH